jgi:hypothetical protein
MNKEFYLYYRLNNGDIKYITGMGEINIKSIKAPDVIRKYALKYLVQENENEITDDDLKKHLVKFLKWMNDIRYNKVLVIRYCDNFSNDVAAVCGTFKKFVKFEHHDKIGKDEYLCMEKSYNGALYYMNPEYINKPVQCYSYDKKLFYVNIFQSDLMIPTKTGIWQKLNKLPKSSKDIKYGFYRVKISTDNYDIYKVFNFSKYDTYLDISLKRAMKLKKQFNLKIELIDDDKPNAYIYQDDDMIALKDISDKWYTKMTELRKLLPDNPYVKFLGNTAWSSMNQRKSMYLNDSARDKLDVTSNLNIDSEYKQLKTICDVNGEYRYEIVNVNKPYMFNIRLKSWITAKARDIMCEIALKHLDKIVRIQTDSISFTEEIKSDDPLFVIEEKTTGIIQFENVNRYKNMTTGYQSKNFITEENI